MTDYRRSEIVTGGFVVAAVVAFALLSLRVGRADPLAALRPEPLSCESDFADIATLQAGARVTVAGRRVGTVEHLRLVTRPDPGGDDAVVHTRVTVQFAIDDLELRLDPETARVRLAQEGLLGRHLLELDPGSWPANDPAPTAAELRRDGKVLVLPGEAPVGVATVLAEARPILQRLAKLLDGADDQSVQRTVLAPLQALIGEAQIALTQLRSRVLDQTLPHAERVLDEAAAASSQGRATLTALQRTIDDDEPKLAALLDQLTTTTRNLETRASELENELAATLQTARGTMAENRPEIAETIRRLRRTMWQLEMAARKVRTNPAVLLFGDDEADLEAGPIDESALRRRGQAPIYRQRDEGR